MSGCRAPFKDILQDITLEGRGYLVQVVGSEARADASRHAKIAPPKVTVRYRSATARDRTEQAPSRCCIEWARETTDTVRRRERTVRPPQAIWCPPHDAMRAHPEDNAALSYVEISSYPRVDIALNPVTYSNWYVKARVHSVKDASFSFIGCVRWKSTFGRFSTVCLWEALSIESFSKNWNLKIYLKRKGYSESKNVNRQYRHP